MAGNSTLYNVGLQISCNATAVQRVADALTAVLSNPSNLVSLLPNGPSLLDMMI